MLPEHHMEAHMTERLIRIRDVMERTGLSRTVLYRKIQHNDFPQPVRITIRCVGWLESEINAWVNQRIEGSRSNNAA
jgi:prophage regulatory protein